jgi:hypothetical protein
VIKVFQSPSALGIQDANFGILRVAVELHRGLAPFVEWVATPEEADVLLCHADTMHAYRCRPDQSRVVINHGLYPTGEHHDPAWLTMNKTVIENLRLADAVIVPSVWVHQLLQQNMAMPPYVSIATWGIHPDQWADASPNPLGYVLWNKNRPDAVCTPEWIEQLAIRHPNIQFVSTFGPSLPNLRIIGAQTHAQMQGWIKGASVYLATTKETGDIGSREALASGIPVLGFAQGALLDFLEHGVNGYLAKPRSIESLSEGLLYCLRHRTTLGANAKQLAQSYTWDQAIQCVWSTIQISYNEKRRYGSFHHPYITVVIPCHNYAQYVGEAIKSVLPYIDGKLAELIVVDDASTDNSQAVIHDTITAHFGGAPDNRLVHVLHNDVNQGVAQTRNRGLARGGGKYALCLDADDLLAPNALTELLFALENHPECSIAYSGQFAFVDAQLKTDWLTAPFDYERQADGTWNQIPTCCLFNREVAIMMGGYRTDMQPAEDADLWTRLITYTGKLPIKAMSRPSFYYRTHANSLSQTLRRNPYAERGKPIWTGNHRPFIAPVPPSQLSNPVYATDAPLVKIETAYDYDYRKTMADIWRTEDSLDNQTDRRWSLQRHIAAPLLLRIETGDTIPPDFIERALQQGQWPSDTGQVKEVVTMACCGQIDRQQTIQEGDLILAKWTYNNHDNPIPSPTNQRDMGGRLIYYRGNIGGNPIYVHRKDLESQKNKDYKLWEVIPEHETLIAVPVIPPAPEPPTLLVVDELPSASEIMGDPVPVLDSFATDTDLYVMPMVEVPDEKEAFTLEALTIIELIKQGLFTIEQFEKNMVNDNALEEALQNAMKNKGITPIAHSGFTFSALKAMAKKLFYEQPPVVQEITVAAVPKTKRASRKRKANE